MTILGSAYLLLGFLFLGAALYVASQVFRHFTKKMHRLTMLLIQVPKKSTDPYTRNENEGEIEPMRRILHQIAQLNTTVVFEAAIHAIGEEIHFYALIPNIHATKLTQIIESELPGSHITSADDYDLWFDGSTANAAGALNEGELEVGYLKSLKPYAIPFMLPTNPNSSAFHAIINELGKINAIGEAAVLQWVIRPAAKQLQQDISHLLNTLAGGTYVSSPLIDPKFLLACDTMHILEKKIAEPLFAVNARILVSSLTPKNAQEMMERLEHAYVNASGGVCYNEFKMTHPRSAAKASQHILSRRFDADQQVILNASEIATMFHIPTHATPGAKIKRIL
jgi:hypothetical protein